MKAGWDDGLFTCISVVFWCLAFKAVSLVGDLDKSGKLIAPCRALQEMGHGMARYSMGWGLDCTLRESYQWDRQSSDVHLIKQHLTFSPFQTTALISRTKSAFSPSKPSTQNKTPLTHYRLAVFIVRTHFPETPDPTAIALSSTSRSISHSPKTTRHLPKTPDHQPD